MVAGWILAVWGETLAELNDLDGAVRQARKGTNLTERGKDVAMIGWSYLCLMRVLFSKRDLAGADQLIHKMELITRDYHVSPWINMEAAFQWVIERGWIPVETSYICAKWNT